MEARFPNLLPIAFISVVYLSSPAIANKSNKIENALKSRLSFPSAERRRAAENGTALCDLCVDFGGTLVGDVYPEYDLGEEVPQNLSCSELSEIMSVFDKSDEECYSVNVEFHGDCCKFPVSTAECEQEVHELVTGDDSGYNFDIEPLQINEEKVRVGATLQYFALTSIDTKEGTAELFLGIELDWIDKRLVWDPKELGGCYYTNFRASNDPELTNIWVPPLDLGNRASSLQDFPQAYASASSVGQVYWFRFGGMKALCFFDGLERFPYDELLCDFTFSNTLIFSRITYELFANLTFLEDERKYQEFSILKDKSYVEIINDGGSINGHFVFKRSSRYYNNTIVIPTILFTILSFGVFLLDQRVGERLGFGVSILLVIVAQAILTADTLPVTEERLWVNILTQGSQYFAIAAVMESVFVAYLHYIKVEPPEIDDDKLGKNKNDLSSDAFAENSGESVSFLNETNGEPNSIENDTNPDNVLEGADNPKEETEDGRSPSEEKPSFVTKVKNFHWTAKSIRKLDRVCLVLLPTSYLIFITVMFATNENWGKK